MILEFRAWHDGYKQMCPVTWINFENKTASIIYLDNNRQPFFRNVQLSEIELTQCTGTLDKKKARIFIGDIVEWDIPPHNLRKGFEGWSKGKGLVKFNRASCQIEGIYIGQDFYLNEIEQYVKVIGNKFENPELAKGIYDPKDEKTK